MKTVLVTGASGQLGKCLQDLAGKEDNIDWLFMDSSTIDITSTQDISDCFNSKSIDYCINCAAYTNVEKAEQEQDKAFLINAEAVKNLAKICKANDVVLIHISTDYVFNGKVHTPYQENDPTDPINIYGASKLKGEEHIQEIMKNYFIIRTSWLYSQYGHNFFKTILKKADEGAVLNITTAQEGTPTNANHLAAFILQLVTKNNSAYGLYHFSNEGQTTWYGFAKEILRISGNLSEVELNKDNSYKTIAQRPAYSVLNKHKAVSKLGVEIASWEEAVQELYKREVNK